MSSSSTRKTTTASKPSQVELGHSRNVRDADKGVVVSYSLSALFIRTIRVRDIAIELPMHA